MWNFSLGFQKEWGFENSPIKSYICSEMLGMRGADNIGLEPSLYCNTGWVICIPRYHTTAKYSLKKQKLNLQRYHTTPNIAKNNKKWKLPRYHTTRNITQSIPRYHAAQIILNNTLTPKNEIFNDQIYLIGIVVYPKLVIQAKIECHNVPRFWWANSYIFVTALCF